jgi:hypothetical protein
MMDKVDIKDVKAHPIYHYLKKVVGSGEYHHLFFVNDKVSFYLIMPVWINAHQYDYTAAAHPLEFPTYMS